MIDSLLVGLMLFLVGSPLLMMTVIGARLFLGRPDSEDNVGRLVLATIAISLAAALAIAGTMLWVGHGRFEISLGNWIDIPAVHFHLAVKLQLDTLSLTFAIMSLVLCGVIGRFAIKYLHREPGYHRFFFLYAMFTFGLMLTTLAGTIETLFAGWELVGVSSAFLVAFFDTRIMPAINGLRVWTVYRLADAAFLIAAVTLHHMEGGGDFSALSGTGVWPTGTSELAGWSAFGVGLLIVIAAAGKSALIPFSGWLPRAMEGPTPSSAIFYGALSVHLGIFLLLRIEPIIDQSVALQVLLIVLGLSTALVAEISGRVQADLKSALSFASLVQVGIIVTEVGFGFRIIALIHIVSHAFFRTLQLLRAPSLLQDYSRLENAIGGRLSSPYSSWFHRLPGGWGRWLYRFGLERGRLDDWLDVLVVGPFLRFFRRIDQFEQRLLARSHEKNKSAVPVRPLSASHQANALPLSQNRLAEVSAEPSPATTNSRSV